MNTQMKSFSKPARRVAGFLLLGSAALLTVFSLGTVVAQATGIWTPITSMNTARYAFGGVQLKNGKVLISGGIDGNGILATAELYNPATGTWSTTGRMRTPRAYHSMTLLPNGSVLVAGGCANSSCSAATATAEIYNPKTGKWQSAGKMSTLRYFFGATSLPDGRVLVEGGCNKGNCGTVTASAELFDPTTRTWTLTGGLKIARDYHTATLLASGRVLVAGGYTVQGASNGSEIYDPAAGIWSSGPNMISGRALHSATALPDGRAVIAGGIVGFLPSDLTEVYDPVANTWSSAGNLNTKRAGQTAVMLATGQAMVIGGYSYVRPVYFELASCELFDAAIGTWSFAADMTDARDHHVTISMANGQVIAAGGISGSTTLSSADIYTP